MGEPIGFKGQTCPHCGGAFAIGVTAWVELGQSATAPTPAIAQPAKSVAERTRERNDRWVSALTPTQRGIIDEAKTNGLLDALMIVVEFIPAQCRPKNVYAYLLTCLAVADPITNNGAIPRALLVKLRNVYPVGKLGVYKAHSVLIVTLEGKLQGFLPTSVLSERRPSKFHPDRDAEDSGWFKTRFGYVPGHGLMFDELRQRYLGAFDKVTG